MNYKTQPVYTSVQQCKPLRQLVSTLLATTVIVPSLFGLTKEATAGVVNARASEDLIDTMCLNTHFRHNTSIYGTNYSGVKQKLVDLGFRHIRDSGTSDDWIAKMKDLSKSGVKVTIGIDPIYVGIVPNSSYSAKVSNPQPVAAVVKQIGTDVVDAVEGINEIDLNYQEIPGLNNDPSSPSYWAKYARTTAIDTWNALKGDPATSGVKVLGPTLASWYDKGTPSPIGDISAYVDWGNFHPYPFNGNPYGDRSPYGGIAQYYLNANFPLQNLDEYPFSFEVYAQPFGSKPMAATETGYYTKGADKSISEYVQAKYMPRLFLEYFRLGIVRTCSFEFVDGVGHATENWGILRNDLSPKPAYTALKNLTSLLKDTGGSFSPGALDYSFTFEPPSGYDRTKYVHSLLLQKSNGKYYLAIWHEISDNDLSSNPPRELNPPAVPTTINFSSKISGAKLYSLGSDGNMSSSGVSISNNSISLDVKDTVSVLEISP